MRKNHLINQWAKLYENEEHPLENASSRELIPYVGEEIKKMKEDLEKCLRDVAYRFENSHSHPDMMNRYKKIRDLIDGTKKELVDKIYRIARGESIGEALEKDPSDIKTVNDLTKYLSRTMASGDRVLKFTNMNGNKNLEIVDIFPSGKTIEFKLSEKKTLGESKSFAKKWMRLCEGISAKNLIKESEEGFCIK